jgi:hypothetical protein
MFDHDKTDFALTGKHEGLDCHACHVEPTDGEVEQSGSCYTCHQSDDIHRGRFGRNCSRCHTSESFRDIDMRQ